MMQQRLSKLGAGATLRRWRDTVLALPPRVAKSGPVGWTFIALTVVALGMRLWDLGGRTLHYDEILHAYYSWLFLEHFDYKHTPLTHGPFLFHAGAAVMWLFGASDVTIRLIPALFATALVPMPYLLRRWMGTPAAIAAAVFLLVSPSLLYFGRFIRNDIFMAVFALGLFAIMWHYFHRPRTSLLVGWTVLWALAYTSKESSFLLAGTFGLFLLTLSGPNIWQWVRGRRKLSDIGPAGDLVIVLGTFSLPMWAPIFGLVQDYFGLILVNPDGNDPRVIAGEVTRAATETGAPAGGGLYIAVFMFASFCAISIVLGLLWDRKRWPWLAALFIGITLFLFTSVFSNWNGFFTGYWGSLGYWVAQHHVERANQPLYYYAIGLTVYEFAVLIPSLIGGVYLAIRGTLFDRALVGWAVLTFGLFSFAGERMPWLLVGITLPLTLIAGRIVGLMFERAWGSRYSPAGFVGGLGLMLTIPFAVVQLIISDSATTSVWFWVAIWTIAVVVAGATTLALRLRPDPALSEAAAALGVLMRERRMATLGAAGLGAMAVLLAFTVFTAGRASYSHASFERPWEMLIYSQTGQETTWATECIDRIAEGSGLGTDDLRIVVGESDSNAWQWRWYLRDYDNVQYQGFNTGDPPSAPLQADVVIISRAVESRMGQALDGFVEAGDLHHLWWFPNWAYGGITPGSLWNDIQERDSWQTVVRYFLFRDREPTAMQHSNGVVYVADRFDRYADGCTDLRAAEPGGV